MATISVTNISDGDAVTAASINNQINTIVNDYNGNITNANIASGAAISADKLAGGTSGMFGAWSTWTPTLTNLSGGTQTYAKWIQIGKTVHFRFKYTLAGAGVSGVPGFTLPTTPVSGYDTDDNGTLSSNVLLRDAGTGDYLGFLTFGTATRVDVYAVLASGTYAAYAGISSTVPFTWANGDNIQVHGTYETA